MFNNTLAKLRYLDLYAYLPSLTFGKNQKIHSRFSFILTLLTIIIIATATIFLGIQVVFRQKPSIIQYQLPAKSLDQAIPFNTDSFKYATQLYTGDDANYYSVSALLLGSNNVLLPLTVDSCDFSRDFQQEAYCFSQDDATKSQTKIGNDGQTGIIIYFSSCVNSTANGNSCYSPEDIDQMLQIGTYTLEYNDWTIDPTDYESPLKSTKSYFTDYTMSNSAKILLVTLKQIQFTSDNGWLFEQQETTTKFSASIEVRTKEKPDNNFLEIQVLYSGATTVYKRTYPKIPDLLAQISGFITIIIPVCILLLSPYSNIKMLEHLVNEIYEIKLTDRQPKPRKSLKRRTRSINSQKYQSIIAKPEPIEQKETEVGLIPAKQPDPPQNRTPVENSIEIENPVAPHKSINIKPLSTMEKINLDNIITEGDEEFSSHRPLGAENNNNSNNNLPNGDAPKIYFHQQDSSPIISPENHPARSLSNPFRSTTLLLPQALQSKNDHDEGLRTPHNKPPQLEIPQKPKTIVTVLDLKDETNNSTSKPSIEEEQQQAPPESLKSIEILPIRTSDTIKVSWSEWFKSFFKPQPQIKILHEAKTSIFETLDLVTLAKKVVEIDKLKACLLTHEQRVLFENLPASMIVFDSTVDIKSEEAIRQYHWKESYKGDQRALKTAYMKIKKANPQKKLDRRLIKLYESEYLEDADAAMIRKHTSKI